MAINLTIALNDNEQARLISIAKDLNPDMTGPQLKVWAEELAKDSLREAVVEQWQSYRRELVNTQQREAEKALTGAWEERQNAE